MAPLTNSETARSGSNGGRCRSGLPTAVGGQVGCLLLLPFLLNVLTLAPSPVHGAGPYPHATQPTGTAPLFVVADGSLAPGDVVTLQTLAGALARLTPRVYRVTTGLNDTDSYALWLRELQEHGVAVNATYLHDLPGLLGHFSGAGGGVITGYVTFTASGESANAAITYCAGSPPPAIVRAEMTAWGSPGADGRL